MTLQALGPDLWAIDHPLVVGGLALGTRTTIVRRPDGSVVLFSPGPLDDDDAAAIAALGPVGAVVAPNLMHYRFAAAACARFAGAPLFAPAALTRKRPELTVAGPPAAVAAESAGTLRAIEVGGMPKLQETLFVHSPSRTLIATDVVFNLRPPAPWLTRAVMACNGGFDRFGPTRIVRAMVKDRGALRAGMAQLLALDFDRVVLAHGRVRETGGPAAVREAFRWMRPATTAG